MGLTEDYNSLRAKKKKKEEEERERAYAVSTKGSLSDQYNSLRANDDDDIAPVRYVATTTGANKKDAAAQAKKKKEEEENKADLFGLDLFQEGAFDDGYQFGDVTKTILGTAGDVVVGAGEGVVGTLEGLVDLGYYGVAGVADAFGAKEFAQDVREDAKTNATDNIFRDAREGLDEWSVLGDTAYGAAGALGQIGLVALTGGAAGAAGLGTVGTTALTSGTLGLSSMGSGMSEAYQGGATDEEALTYGLIAGASDTISEMLFGGMGKAVKGLGFSKGLTSIDDVLAKKVSGMFSNQIVKNFAEFGIKAGAEGFEEVLAGIGQAAGKKATYMSEEEFDEILKDENLLEQFVIGTVASGIMQSGVIPGTGQGSLRESNKTGRDFITGLNKSEQSVIDKVYQDRIAEAEKEGKVTGKDKTKIYDEVMRDMEKGYITTDTIEEVLGGDSYKAYKSALDQHDSLRKEYDTLLDEYNILNKMKRGEMTGEQQDRQAEVKAQLEGLLAQIKDKDAADNRTQLKVKLNSDMSALLKDSRLTESYNERARRGQAFEADLSQYNDAQKAIVQKAIDSGFLNNTNRTHEFVDMVAKISADKGVSFDFTNNTKLQESGFALKGKTINGYVTKDGITVNMDSAKSVNSVVGHEITHVLEGTELYTELQKAVKAYAESKGDYKGRYDTLAELYKGIKDADIDAELTADLVGDYLFTDSDFINRLSTEHRNVFQKIYDEIKYLCRVATAGSKEARQLEKVKKAFDKAYKEGGKVKADSTKYDIVALDNGNVYVSASRKVINGSTVEDMRVEVSNFFSDLLEGNPSLDIPTIDGDVLTITKSETAHKARDNYKLEKGNRVKMTVDEFALKSRVEAHIDEVAEVSKPFGKDSDKKNHSFAKDGFTYRKAYFEDFDGEYYEITLSIGKNGTVATVYNVGKMEKSVLPSAKIIAGVGSKPLGKTLSKKNIPQNGKNVKRQYSLADNTGKQLSKGQQEYFKDSKMRDENGNLMVMYHGSQDAGFHTFDSRFSDDGTSFFFVDNNDAAASYSGTTETYEAKSFKTAEDFNSFFADIGKPYYEVVEENGKFSLLENGDFVAESDTAQGIYEEFRDWEGVGYGDANYKVYLNLKNPLVVDADGRNWNNVSREFSQEIADIYNAFTAKEKAALSDVARDGDIDHFRDEIANAEHGALAKAFEKISDNVNPYDVMEDLFHIASENFSDESIQQFAVKQMTTRDYAQRAKEQGYDGVIFKNIVDLGGYSNGSEGAATVAVAFDSNQIKSVANTEPTSNPDIRYSLSTDSDGNSLSNEQIQYFHNSKIVDANGNLKVMHHGTNESFTVFDKKKARSSGTYGSGFYFTDSNSHASTYGNSVDVYLNITNPLQDGANNITKDQLRNFVEAIAEDEDYGIDNYGYGATVDSVTDSVYGKSDFAMILDINISCVGDMVKAVELFNKVNGTDYDGIVAPTETVAFYPEQIKRVDNKAPTSDSDIRFSLSEYTAEEKKAHNDAVLEHFGKTYNWNETGYLLLDGTKLDLSGKHDGAPGGYRTVDHRDITEALGYDYGGGDYSGSLIQFMSEGNIRIIPECNGINLSVKPTKEQEQALSSYIAKYRGEVLLDIDDLNGNTVVSVEYPYGTYYSTVLNDIREWFDNGKKPENAGGYSLTKEGTQPRKYGNYNVSGQDLMLETETEQEELAPIAPIADDAAPADILPDDYAPPVDDVAPVMETAPVAPVAPVKEAVEAIRPKPTKEPRMARATPAEQARAEILTEEPKDEKKKGGLWSKVKNNVLDKGMVFEDLSLATGNRELQARWNSIRYAESKAQKLIGEGNANVSSLDSIRSEVESTGKTQQFYEYLYHLHNADRMTLSNRYADVEDKPVFGYSVTAEMSQETAAQLEKANPEFKQYAREVYEFNDYLRELLVDGGVISRETANLWKEMYPHYVPVRRLGDDGLNINVPLDTGRTGVNAPIKRAKGGNRDILPLFDTMAMRAIQTYKAVAKNRFGVELKNTLGTTIDSDVLGIDEAIDSIDAQDGLLQEGKNGQKPTFTVFENGEKVTFEITDEMYDAMKPTSEGMATTIKPLNAFSNFRRGTLTEYNPWFLLKNAVKDVQDILLNSQHATKTYASIPKAITQMATKGHWYQEYLENGGAQNTYFDKQSNEFAKENKTIETLKTVFGLNAIAKANNVVEMMPRLAEYIASREAGRSVDVSMLDAARVTTNFAAGGDLTKMLNRNGATFLNASVQGAMQQVRNIREAKMNGLRGWAGLAGKYIMAGLPALLLNGLIWDDDEEYEELSDYVKQNYYIVGKYGDGQFVRIPKGRAVAVIQNAFEQIQNASTGDDELDLKAFIDLAISNLAPNNPLDNNIFSPVAQVVANKTWYGEDLVPTRLQDLPAAEQYDESTDAISRWLGETFGVSPYKANYLLDQYSGVIGDTFLPMLTPEAESGDNSFAGNMIAPLKDMFTTDSVMNNQNVSNFYDKVDELTVNANSSKATDEDVLKYKYINSINADMGELYGQKREIQASDLPDDVKYSQVREIQRQIDEMAAESLKTYNNVNITGEYATVGDRHYRWYEPGEDSDAEPGWQKLTDKQLEKQEKVTSGLGIEPSEYWSNKEEYDYAYEYPEKYAVAKSVGGYTAFRAYSKELYDIKSDKDSSGKTITGSRKEKVIDYVNNLDIDYGMRLILFKSEYNADDTYNYDIVEYLNSRDDISYEEMETILKELGFTVYADGTITW